MLVAALPCALSSSWLAPRVPGRAFAQQDERLAKKQSLMEGLRRECARGPTQNGAAERSC